MPRYQTDPLGDAPPPPLGTSDEPGPIGVPKDYLAPTVKSRTYSYDDEDRLNTSVPSSYLGSQAPTYYDGDEWIPAAYSAADIFAMQSALAKVGLLRGSWSGGYWDTPTMNAYKELLGMANASGATDADQLLSRMVSQAGDTSGLFTVDENGNVVMVRDESQTRAPLVTRTTDPAALKSLFRRAVIELRGEGWDDDKLNQMVSAYNSLEVERQTAAYNTEVTGGSVVDIPSPELFAESYAREQDPEGVQSQQFLDVANQFMEFAGNTAWGVG